MEQELAKLNASRLTKPIKFRVIDELKTVFRNHPVYKEIESFIQNKYALEERPQFGIVVKNLSGDLIQLSADNFVGTLISHVFLARVANYKCRSIEWIREDIESNQISVTEDVSSQFDGTRRFFFVSHKPITDPRNGELAFRTLSVRVTINKTPVLIESMRPEQGLIYLENSPKSTDVVSITYSYRNLEPPGIYYVEITGKNDFVIDPVYVIEDEVVTESYNGFSTDYQLKNFPLLIGTTEVWRDKRIELYPNVDYSVDGATGILTLLIPSSIPRGTLITVSYKYPGQSRGPFPLAPERSNNQAIKGVVIAFERGMEVGDKQAIIVKGVREQVADVFGGKWNLSMPLEIYAKDPIQREELADLTVSAIWETLKPRLDAEGIVIKKVSLGGESEEVADETTGDPYYLASVDLSLETDWELHRPLPFAFRKFDYVSGGEDRTLTPDQAMAKEKTSIQLMEVLPLDYPIVRIGFRNFERLV